MSTAEAATAQAPPATPKVSRRKRAGLLTFLTLLEGVSVPVSLIFLVKVWGVNVAPAWDQGVWILLDTLFNGSVIAWFIVANNFAAMESTKDQNLGNDNILPREQWFTTIMTIVLTITFVLHWVFFILVATGAMERTWYSSMFHMSLFDLIFWAGLAFFTYVDHETNNKFIGRAQRLMPDTRFTPASRE